MPRNTVRAGVMDEYRNRQFFQFLNCRPHLFNPLQINGNMHYPGVWKFGGQLSMQFRRFFGIPVKQNQRCAALQKHTAKFLAESSRRAGQCYQCVRAEFMRLYRIIIFTHYLSLPIQSYFSFAQQIRKINGARNVFPAPLMNIYIIVTALLSAYKAASQRSKHACSFILKPQVKQNTKQRRDSRGHGKIQFRTHILSDEQIYHAECY